MNQPQQFNFHGQQVRTVTINDEPYFVGKDVAVILGYKKPENAIANHVEGEDKTTTLIQGTGSNYKSKSVVINESGLYSLILSSKLPTAKEFKHWVTSEVLPSIRKHGAYMTDEKAFNVVHNADGLAELLQQAADQLKAKDVQIAEMKPKVDYFDTQMHNPGLMTVTEISKDYGMTAQELNSLLHKFGIQFKQGKYWVLYRKYDGKGYTQYEPFAYNDNKGVHNNLKWTQRGRKFIYDTLKGRGILPVLEQPELLPEAMD